MRREREELRKLFADKILPHHNVEIDVLCHGVTRKRLKEAIRWRAMGLLRGGFGSRGTKTLASRPVHPR